MYTSMCYIVICTHVYSYMYIDISIDSTPACLTYRPYEQGGVGKASPASSKVRFTHEQCINGADREPHASARFFLFIFDLFIIVEMANSQLPAALRGE